MRILLLNQFYPPDVAPTGQVLHDLARALISRGHDVEVVCSRRSYDGGKKFASRETLDGVRISRLPALGFGRRGFAGKLADYTSFYGMLSLKLFFKRGKPDMILSLTTPPYIGVSGKIAARLSGAAHAHWIMDLYPDVMEAHGMLRKNGALCRVLQRLMRWQLNGAGLVVALGPHMAGKAGRYLPQDCNGASRWVSLWGDAALAPWPQAESNPMRRERGWKEDELVLMYSGNMGLAHRFSEFLAAADSMGADGPRWVFSGGGKRRAEIEDFARAHPNARIELQPYVQREQLRASLCAADVHLASLDSAWQGLLVPSKIQGIFSAGKPVIFVGARDNEIAAWIEESGGGWVVAENDAAGLKGAVSAAADKQERQRRGQAAFDFACKHFDMARNCAQIAEWLEKSMAARKTGA